MKPVCGPPIRSGRAGDIDRSIKGIDAGDCDERGEIALGDPGAFQGLF